MKVSDVTNFFGINQKQEEEIVETPVTGETTPHPKKPRKVLHEWTAQARAEHNIIDKKKAQNLIIIGIVVSLLFAAMGEFMIIIGIASLVFVYYMLAQIKPEDITYKITDEGVYYGDLFYGWGRLKHFFFANISGLESMAIDVTSGLPSRLYFTINPADRDKFKMTLEKYLPFIKEPPSNFVSNTYDSMIRKVKL